MGPRSVEFAKYDKTAIIDAIVNPSAGIVFGYRNLDRNQDGQSPSQFLISKSYHPQKIYPVQTWILQRMLIIKKQNKLKAWCHLSTGS